MQCVRSLKQDATYDQTGVTSRLSQSDMYYSLDLTSATDRLPKELQRRLLSKMIGQEKADNVIQILTGYPFLTRDRKEVTYEVGQPMGAYAS